MLVLENTTLLPSEKVYFTPNKRNISNAILVLNPITMQDRGNFYCIGKNNIVFDPVVSSPSYVRIKGNKIYVVNLHVHGRACFT